MATVREYLTTKLGSFGLNLSASEVDFLLIDMGLSGTEVYSAATSASAKLGLVKAIPELLLRPDISEGGYSVKLDRNAIRAYYAMLCDELGVENTLGQPKLADASYLW